MALFVSTVTNKIDRKGRVSVPAPFRAALAQQSFQGFVAFPSFIASAIEGCPTSFIDDLAAATSNTLDLFSPEQNDLNQLIFSSSHMLAFDPEGRVTLPEELLAHAAITELVSFVGMGNTFQIWEPGTFQARRAEARARAIANPPRLALRREAGP